MKTTITTTTVFRHPNKNKHTSIPPSSSSSSSSSNNITLKLSVVKAATTIQQIFRSLDDDSDGHAMSTRTVGPLAPCFSYLVPFFHRSNCRTVVRITRYRSFVVRTFVCPPCHFVPPHSILSNNNAPGTRPWRDTRWKTGDHISAHRRCYAATVHALRHTKEALEDAIGTVLPTVPRKRKTPGGAGGATEPAKRGTPGVRTAKALPPTAKGFLPTGTAVGTSMREGGNQTARREGRDRPPKEYNIRSISLSQIFVAPFDDDESLSLLLL